MGKIITNDIFGKALIDYQNNNFTENITTYSTVAGKDEMELSWLFRSKVEMPLLEQTALDLCRGSVLDIGCGAGCHTLALQEAHLNITAIDISKGAIEVCKKRGVKNAFNKNFWELKDTKFDTILVLMNGTGLSGKLDNLHHFLNHLKSLLTEKGQILIDSSDIIYMYQDNFGDIELPNTNKYYGEVIFEFKYKNQFSKKFNWLFIDFKNLKKYAQEIGLNCALVKEGYHHDYLARLTIINAI